VSATRALRGDKFKLRRSLVKAVMHVCYAAIGRAAIVGQLRCDFGGGEATKVWHVPLLDVHNLIDSICEQSPKPA
jgi:hypothetical protein